jgi:dienelactone hydrolase
MNKKLIAILILALFLSGCKGYNRDLESIEKFSHFEKVLVKGGDFWITTYQKISNKNKPYVFYIEGDGSAFNGKYRVSSNPTPKSHLLIDLAAMDERPNVVYIARPCQYTPMHLNPTCNSKYWTNKRLSDDSVQSLNDVINSINNNHNKFSLVGYSGGGGVAVLIAARNHMVKDIITIAGNLDIVAFTGHHKVTPMIGSLNPIDYAWEVRNIPQLHVSGGKDTIVPPFIANKFVQKASSNCVKQMIFQNTTHWKGWDIIWKDLYKTPVLCY